MTCDLETLRSCSLSLDCESLMCHQECWELPSLVMGTQRVSLPVALCPSSQQAPLGPALALPSLELPFASWS